MRSHRFAATTAQLLSQSTGKTIRSFFYDVKPRLPRWPMTAYSTCSKLLILWAFSLRSQAANHRAIDTQCSTRYLYSTVYRKRGLNDLNDRTSRSCPEFEKDNMAKHRTRPSSGLASSAAPLGAIRMEFARRLQERAGPELARHMAPLLISCRDDGHAPGC